MLPGDASKGQTNPSCIRYRVFALQVKIEATQLSIVVIVQMFADCLNGALCRVEPPLFSPYSAFRCPVFRSANANRNQFTHPPHPAISGAIAAWLVGNIAAALPSPDEKSGKPYKFIFAFMHSVGGSIPRIGATLFPHIQESRRTRIFSPRRETSSLTIFRALTRRSRRPRLPTSSPISRTLLESTVRRPKRLHPGLRRKQFRVQRSSRRLESPGEKRRAR